MRNWTLEQYVNHYYEVINSQPNGNDQYISPIFGQSHYIMGAAYRIYGEKSFHAALDEKFKQKKNTIDNEG